MAEAKIQKRNTYTIYDDEGIGTVQIADEVFKIRQPELGAKINVIGQIDLAALNQSTRPKKKSKEEKRREREERGYHTDIVYRLYLARHPVYWPVRDYG